MAERPSGFSRRSAGKDPAPLLCESGEPAAVMRTSLSRERISEAMQIWPAIDLRGGKCVRLQQGDYNRETVFGEDPAAMARHWTDQGAEFLHLVDLDGARDGRPTNLPAIRAIVEAVDVPCELGGGVRDEETIASLLELGVARLVIGTKALAEPDWFRSMCRRFPGRLVLGIDARDGRVATEGWLETSEALATELAAQYQDEPLAALIYTDIATDGMLAGPNLAAMQEMRSAVKLPVIASGGVTSASDVTALANLPVAGCIIGRALYEGKLQLADALAAAREVQAH
jgi:phosphoribosylformimino-5-aminoimidazole carboxamide ribotide isomerase